MSIFQWLRRAGHQAESPGAPSPALPDPTSSTASSQTSMLSPSGQPGGPIGPVRGGAPSEISEVTVDDLPPSAQITDDERIYERIRTGELCWIRIFRFEKGVQDEPTEFTLGAFGTIYVSREEVVLTANPSQYAYLRKSRPDTGVSRIEGNQKLSFHSPPNQELEIYIISVFPSLAPYCGLYNQGATCYMNSILQSLFFTPAFVQALFQIPLRANPADGTDQPSQTIPLSLQRLFFEMMLARDAGPNCRRLPVDTQRLTRSFGWDVQQSFQQHDVQEFNRILCDNLETGMKGTSVEGRLNQLLEGEYKSYIRCLNVEYESSRTETFFDIQLNVQGLPNLERSFEQYISEERLDGENAYNADGFGLQAATKGVIFTKFPPVLHLQLKRYEYDIHTGNNVKVTSHFEFPDTIDLGPYMEKDEHGRSQSKIYHLYGVLVHEGTVNLGHYFSFLRPRKNGLWYQFNDDEVNPVDYSLVTRDSFGSNQQVCRQTTTAYMLVYFAEEHLDEIFTEFKIADVPSPLAHYLETSVRHDAPFPAEYSPPPDTMAITLSTPPLTGDPLDLNQALEQKDVEPLRDNFFSDVRSGYITLEPEFQRFSDLRSVVDWKKTTLETPFSSEKYIDLGDYQFGDHYIFVMLWDLCPESDILLPVQRLMVHRDTFSLASLGRSPTCRFFLSFDNGDAELIDPQQLFDHDYIPLELAHIICVEGDQDYDTFDDFLLLRFMEQSSTVGFYGEQSGLILVAGLHQGTLTLDRLRQAIVRARSRVLPNDVTSPGHIYIRYFMDIPAHAQTPDYTQDPHALLSTIKNNHCFAMRYSHSVRELRGRVRPFTCILVDSRFQSLSVTVYLPEDLGPITPDNLVHLVLESAGDGLRRAAQAVHSPGLPVTDFLAPPGDILSRFRVVPFFIFDVFFFGILCGPMDLSSGVPPPQLSIQLMPPTPSAPAGLYVPPARPQELYQTMVLVLRLQQGHLATPFLVDVVRL
ncbi:hypothetical protein, variant [Fonticula alba]|uniref:Ubiquitin carboxyl-terminal hydrolase n=1 Tax=Fonticula alba TaxID=691883 RepID=A0A058Z848_FONAL|nr:hypothetical protein, variant [Fonticula alba]KCV70445.1 hypothetical protein, variant [Fonticula alba]|eukprot:XP_009494961.1 hypothetical protein, variant [Fonticula alba]